MRIAARQRTGFLADRPLKVERNMRRIVNLERHRWIAPRSFYKEVVLIMLPAVLQQMVSSLFNFVDNLMVGNVDAPTLAGVAIANKVFLIFSGIFWGLSGTGAILISQFYGADDREECDRIFLLQILLGLMIGTLFAGILTVFPSQIMTFFNRDPLTVAAGLAYFKTVRFSYIPAALTMVGLFSMRAIGQNTMPLVAGIGAMLVNVALNWILIFGHFGFAPMGARGAGLATLVARLLEASAYLVWIAAGRTLFSWHFQRLRQLSRPVLRVFFAKAVPLTTNEFLYTFGLSALFWAYSRMNDTAVPAFVIMDQISQIMLVVFGGMTSAVSIFVGTRLGAGQFDQARINARLLIVFQGFVALVMMVLTWLAAPYVPRLFAVTAEIRQLTTWLTVAHSLFYVAWITHANFFFILRAGGDMRAALRSDALQMWLLPIPVAVAIAWFWPRISGGPIAFVHLPWVFAGIQVLFNAKIIPALRYYRRGNWLKNLTQ